MANLLKSNLNFAMKYKQKQENIIPLLINA